MVVLCLATIWSTCSVSFIAAVPDGKTAQAMLVQRLSSDLVLEYEAIELVRSSDMPAMFQRLKEIEAADNSLPK